jgi:hypothetical protein
MIIRIYNAVLAIKVRACVFACYTLKQSHYTKILYYKHCVYLIKLYKIYKTLLKGITEYIF